MRAILAPTGPRALVGSWSLRRRLHDRRNGWFGSASGTLTVTASDWLEQGTADFGSYHASFERRLLIARHDDEWWLHFSNGRPFHPWRLDEVVEHPCADDRYRGRLALSGSSEWLRVLWDVSGPAKSQRLCTTFRRLGPW